MAIITGTNGNDNLPTSGTSPGDDEFRPLLGNDLVKGGAGHDILVVDYSSIAANTSFNSGPYTGVKTYTGSINSATASTKFNNIEEFRIKFGTGHNWADITNDYGFDLDATVGGADQLAISGGPDLAGEGLTIATSGWVFSGKNLTTPFGSFRGFEGISIRNPISLSAAGSSSNISVNIFFEGAPSASTIVTGSGNDALLVQLTPDGRSVTANLGGGIDSVDLNDFFTPPAAHTVVVDGSVVTDSFGSRITGVEVVKAGSSSVEGQPVFTATVKNFNGHFDFTGGSDADRLTLDYSTRATGGLLILRDSSGSIDYSGGAAANDPYKLNSGDWRLIDTLSVKLGSGNDRVELNTGFRYAIHGGGGTDTAFFDWKFVNFGDFDFSNLLALPNNRGSLTSFERLNFVLGADVSLRSGATDDVIKEDSFWAINRPDLANSSSNTFDGGAGNDVLEGGIGNDRLIGGTGTDTAVYNDSIDRFVFAALPNGELGISHRATNNLLGADTVSGVEFFQFTSGQVTLADLIARAGGSGAINGTPGNDVLNGTAGADRINGLAGDDVINGLAGADTMAGGLGKDTYYVDNINDVVIEEAIAGQTDKVFSSVSTYLRKFVEDLALTGTAVTGKGNELANVIIGNAANNTLSGGAGNDTVKGEAGNDKISGGSGLDVLTGGAGADAFIFGAGIAANADRITDCVRGTDTLQFKASDYGLVAGALAAADLQLAANATTGSSQFLFNAADSTLYWDADGAAGGAIKIATLTGITTLGVTDFVLV